MHYSDVRYLAFSDSIYYGYWQSVSGDSTWIILNENPFVEAPSPGVDGTWGTADDFYGDLRLKSNSICINAGNPDSTAYDKLSTDFYGNIRIADGRIDIGVSESEPLIVYSLKGKVHAGISVLSSGIVYAYNSTNNATIVDSCYINADGTFEFAKLVSAEYIFKAVPNKPCSYLPTFFGNETEKEHAIAINVDDTITDVDIHLKMQTTLVHEFDSLELPYIYPTIAKSKVSIVGAESVESIIIYNSTGIVVAQYAGNQNTISITNLSHGFYIVSMQTNRTTVNQQLIVK